MTIVPHLWLLESPQLPRTHYDWLHLRLQGYKSVSEYNYAIFKITSQLKFKLCGETTKICWKKYIPLSMPIISSCGNNIVIVDSQNILHLFQSYFLIKKNNVLLMKNHLARSTSSTPIQARECYFKRDWTKHNDKKLFFTHEVHKKKDIDVGRICSWENSVDLFIEAVPTSSFEKLVHENGQNSRYMLTLLVLLQFLYI